MATSRTTEQIIAELSLDEKIHVMSGNTTWPGEITGFIKRGKKGVYNFKPYPAGGISRLGIPPVMFVDGPRGVVCGHSTCFPVSMARGASWDVDLEERIGEAIGKEVRAHGGNYFGGVCINLLRHPAWGRAQETYGEDPIHLGEMGGALVRGVQKHNVMACVKHFAQNSMENARFKVDVLVDERTLREVYLPHFRKCIVEEKAASVMSAYNKVRGVYCGENGYLLQTILRDEWGFEGFVISDFIWGTQNAVASVKNGLDIEMHIKRKFSRLKSAVKRGEIEEKTLDKSVTRILKTTSQYTDKDDPQEYPASCIASDEHIRLARESAEKSMVLLKNERHTLPFDQTKISRLAVFGNLADKPNTGDHGSSYVRPPYVVAPLEGIRNYLTGKVEVLHDSGQNISRAGELASRADAAVVVVGNDAGDEGEYMVNSSFIEKTFKKLGISFGGDRDNLSLKQSEIELIKTVASSNDDVCVLVVGGSAIMMEEWKDSVPAILMTWYPGMEGGAAMARILFGEVNPSAKLPFTIPKDVNDLPPFDKLAITAEYGYYHGYTLLDKNDRKPAFAFGHGLSYSSFKYSNFVVETPKVKPAGELRCSVTVINKSEIAGQEVVQLYFGCAASKVERFRKKLIAFKKVAIPAGDNITVSFEIPAKQFAYFDVATGQWEVEKTTYSVFVGGTSEQSKLQDASFAIE